MGNPLPPIAYLLDRVSQMVYAHRGEQRIVAKADTQSAAWGEAARLAGLVA